MPKSCSIVKYQLGRYRLFHRFNEGIRMDKVTWYSVTPELIARHHARRFREALPSSAVVLDAFLGGAGNAIQFALAKLRVISIELCRNRIEISRHNARVYGVADDIEFLHGNAYHLIPALRGVDGVLLAPPWGGPKYKKIADYNVAIFSDLVAMARAITPNVALLLPKSVDFLHAIGVFGECEVEQNWDEDGVLRMVTIYFGGLIRNVTTKETGPTRVLLAENEVECWYGFTSGMSNMNVVNLPVSIERLRIDDSASRCNGSSS